MHLQGNSLSWSYQSHCKYFLKIWDPEKIVSDNVKEFTNAKIEAFLKLCGINHVCSSPYYARSNRKLERSYRYLKKNFCAAIADGTSWQKDWPKIPPVDENPPPCSCSTRNFAWKCLSLNHMWTQLPIGSIVKSATHTNLNWKFITTLSNTHFRMISTLVTPCTVQTWHP